MSSFNMSNYEISDVEPNRDQSYNVTGVKMYHKIFTPEESSQMENDKSANKRQRTDNENNEEDNVAEPTVKKSKRAVLLKDVNPTLFKYGQVFKLKNGNTNRSLTYGENEAIQSPWLFTQFPPKNFGTINEKSNWAQTASFIGVDEKWTVGQPYPKGVDETQDSIDRHLAFAKTKEMDSFFVDNVYENRVAIFDDVNKPRSIIEKKLAPLATRCFDPNDEEKRYSPQLKVNFAHDNIPVYKINHFNETIPDVPNSSLKEFSELPGKKKGDMNSPKYWVKYMFDIPKETYSKSVNRPLVSHYIKCYGLVYIDKVSTSNYNDTGF